MHIGGWEYMAVSAAITLGAVLQGVIGFGMVVFAFPVVVMIAPELLPQSLLLVGLPLVAVMVVRSWGAFVAREVALIIVGRIPGSLLAVLMLRELSRDLLAIGGAVVVLVAVAASLWAPHVPRNAATMVAAGVASGTFGTSAGIGGPPLGLLYQHETGPRIRSTLSVLTALSLPMSVSILLLAGEFSRTDVRTGFALMPASVVGILLAPLVIPFFDRRLRIVILVVCAMTAAVAMMKIIVF